MVHNMPKYHHLKYSRKATTVIELKESRITMARSKFLGLWYLSQSLAWANSSSFLDKSFRLMSISFCSTTFSSSPPIPQPVPQSLLRSGRRMRSPVYKSKKVVQSGLKKFFQLSFARNVTLIFAHEILTPWNPCKMAILPSL